MYMFSVFSNKLIRSGVLTKDFANKKPSEIMKAYANSGNVLFDYALFTGIFKDEPLYILRPKAIPFLNWVNKNILCCITKDDSITVNVKLRIATGMLNKLEEQQIIPRDVCIVYHMRMVETVKSIHSEIMLEDLPF